jgi:ABC-type cobalamin/Fe3+-siderophores transport system ATPase subunit
MRTDQHQVSPPKIQQGFCIIVKNSTRCSHRVPDLMKEEFVELSRIVVSNYISTFKQFQDPQSNSEHQPPFTFGLEEPRLRFVGRKKELDELKAALTCHIERLWVLAGPGGMGKSQLMKQFLSNVRCENNCVWLFGESAQTLSSSVDSLLRRLQLQYPDRGLSLFLDPLRGTVEHIRNFPNKLPWIFIIDNVDEDHSAARTVATALVKLSNVKTFVTSRLRHIVGGSGVLVEVKPLSDQDAQKYVNDSLAKPQSTKTVLELCATLQNHPLGLSQAVDYIRSEQMSTVKEHYSIEDYLTTFRSHSSKLLKHKVLDENTTVFRTCRISIEMILKKHGKAGKVAISLLRRLAYFNPDGVSRPVFIQFLSESTFQSHTLFADGLGLLKRFSLIWLEEDVITIHRLVQLVTKLENENMWWPQPYTNELFAVSKSLCRLENRYNEPLLLQISIIFQHVLKELGSERTFTRVGTFGNTDSLIRSFLKENDVARVRRLMLYLSSVERRRWNGIDFTPIECEIRNLTKSLDLFEGPFAERSRLKLEEAITDGFLRTISLVESYILYKAMRDAAQQIYKMKHPILNQLYTFLNYGSAHDDDDDDN